MCVIRVMFQLLFLICRTTKLFEAAGLRTAQVNQHTNGIWDQKLEEELKHIASPKLAIPKSDGSIKGKLNNALVGVCIFADLIYICIF